jgi:hypothetical protein
MTYDRHPELLSKRIYKTITPAEVADVAQYESAQPQTWPKCGTRMRSFFIPNQIAHDVDKCSAKPLAQSA